MPRDATHGYTVLAITSLALLGSVLGKPFVRSQCLVPQGLYTESKLLFWIRKPLPRNTGTVSEETQLDVCKTIDFSKDQNWVFACMPHAYSLLLLCARWHHHSKWLRLPKIAMEENHSPYYWKTSSKYNLCSILTFVCLLVFSLCQEFLKSVLWLWHWGRQARQILYTHTHTQGKPDIQYLEINSVKRFGKFIVHAKTFKRHLGSGKSLNSFPFIFFFHFVFYLWSYWSFLFPGDQNEGNLSSTYISSC